MRKLFRLAILLPICVTAFGCSSSSEVGKSELDQAFPTKSQGEIEQELKKDPEAYKQYQESQQKDAEYKAKGEVGRN